MASKRVREWLDRRVKDLDADLKADKANREAAIEDLKFALVPGNQWKPGVVKERNQDGRPTLEINLFPQYIEQLTGDIRHNRPRAQIHPADSQADFHIAKIREGLIADSEYQSNSDYIYVEAATTMVTCGFGAWRTLTRPSPDNPFLNEFYDELIPNPFCVVMDRHAKDPIYADADHCFITSKIGKHDFEKKYPGKEVPGDQLKPGPGLTYENWYDKENVTIAEYYVRKKVKKKMCQMADGSVLAEEDAEQLVKAHNALEQSGLSEPPTPPMAGNAPPAASAPQGQIALQSMPAQAPQGAGAQLPPPPRKDGPKIVKRRDAEVIKIKHYTITACDILSEGGLDGEDVPGTIIPVTLITGKRVNIEGKTYICGIVRNAKDAQRNVNFWYSSAAEKVAASPKAPFIGTAQQIGPFVNDWLQSNNKNFPVLYYAPHELPNGQLAPPPQRQTGASVSSGELSQLTTSLQLFEQAIGMSKNDLGHGTGQPMSGVAERERQRPGDIRTFCYTDNLARGIAHTARIKNEMIPDLYDVQQDVRLRSADGSEVWTPINTTAKDAYHAIQANPNRYKGMNTTKLIAAAQRKGWDAKFNDITAGRYSVKVTVGPSYATQRQEAAETMLRMASIFPKQLGMGLDIILRNQDFKDADVLAKRIEKTLPPGMVQPNPDEPPAPPMPPSPQMLLAKSKMDIEQSKVHVQQMKVQVEKIKAMKELQGEKGELRSQIIELLAEVMAPEGMHPADQQTMLPQDMQ